MFSKTTEYALRATMYIAANSSNESRLGIDEISKAIGSPRSFTAKVLQSLCRNNEVVTSVKGPGGGFFMTDQAKGLTADKIIEVMGEGDVLTKCVLGLPRCSEERPCPMHNEYRNIKAQLVKLFNSTSIGEMVDDTRFNKIFFRGRGKN